MGFFFFFYKTYFLEGSFRVIENLKGKHRDFPIAVPPHTHMQSLPIIRIPYHSGTFVLIDKPAFTRHHRPHSIVDVRVRSWGGTFYGSGQMWKGMHPPWEN